MSIPKEKQTFYSVFINGTAHDVTGRKRTPYGYVSLCVKSHPHSDPQGYVFEHRIVMEMHLGRYLQPNEIVHHKNEVKHDNRLGNLEVMDHVEHTVMHHTGTKRTKEAKEKMSDAAKKRMENKENHPSYKYINEKELMYALINSTPSAAAKEFGVTRKTIYNKIKEFELEEWYKNVK